MNHKKLSFLMMIFILSLICTACGNGNNKETETASGSSVSSSSVNGNSDGKGKVSNDVVEKLDIKLESSQKHFFANKTSYFMEIRDEEGNGIGFDQMVRTGGERTEFRPERFITLLGVTDEGVYYAKQKEGDADLYTAQLYRMPFGKGKSGRTKLEKDKEELILEEPDGFMQDAAAYIDSRYIVYQPYMECVIKYDRDTKEKTELQTGSSTYSIVAAGEKTLVFADLANNDEFLYRLDLESDELERVWEDKENLLDDAMAAHSGYLFCVRGDDIWAYDIEKNKKEMLASKKQILSACDQASDLTGGQMPEEAYVENLFCYNGQLYVQLQLDWTTGKVERMGYAMFRMDLSKDERALEYEITLSVCMSTRSAEHTHAIMSNVKWNSGRCHDIIETGKVILVLNRIETVEQRLASYDMRSREFKLISEEDREYFIPYMDSKKAFGNDDFELKESYMKLMPDDMFAG